jgi:hypothetical protein
MIPNQYRVVLLSSIVSRLERLTRMMRSREL